MAGAGIRAPLPRPMKAEAGELPEGPGWVFEPKWDGMRAVVGIDDGSVRLASANGRDVTASFPELAGLGEALGIASAILDGEIVALVDGRPDFGRLQSRIHVTDPRTVAERAATVPVVLIVFDVLALDGADATALPWTERRRLLEALVRPGPHWAPSTVTDDGAALLAAADANDLEGVVAKRTDSRYEPGRRSRLWRKVKVRRHQELVVGGWATGTGGLASRLGGLLVGYHRQPGGPLHYAGRVGSGITEAERATLAALLADLATDECPFEPPPAVSDARWVRPELVVEVAFAEWTGERRLRHPTYLGRRIDVEPGDVTDRP